jgi:hypothetical protein
MAENIIEVLERKDYQALTSLKIISESDPRFYTQFYDKGHDLYLTPLESAGLGQCGPGNLDEQLIDLQGTAREILEFWKKPMRAQNLEKKYEMEHDELRIHRVETYRDGERAVETMYVVRLGEDEFFSWTRFIF